MSDIEFPLTIDDISFVKRDPVSDGLWSGKCGEMVGIRPCADEYEKKTFLGVFIGDIAVSNGAYLQGTTLRIVPHSNPAIFVPDLNKVIFGYESWWGQIGSVEELHQITNEDINNVWYVKALKALHKEQGE